MTGTCGGGGEMEIWGITTGERDMTKRASSTGDEDERRGRSITSDIVTVAEQEKRCVATFPCPSYI